MTTLPQVSHERVVRALKRAGFYILREGKHISLTDDKHLVIIPRHHVIKPGTLKQILDSQMFANSKPRHPRCSEPLSEETPCL
jgi:predicted RNA binding protein YcfA (HicA-like mRNA interferase family)